MVLFGYRKLTGLGSRHLVVCVGTFNDYKVHKIQFIIGRWFGLVPKSKGKEQKTNKKPKAKTKNETKGKTKTRHSGLESISLQLRVDPRVFVLRVIHSKGYLRRYSQKIILSVSK